MNRRAFIVDSLVAAAACSLASTSWGAAEESAKLDEVTRADWLRRWKEHIADEQHERYCDHEMGEELGWLMSPFLNGFYHGYIVTRDPEWVERFADWTGSWLKRGVKNPDGHVGWPKKVPGTVGTEFFMDSLLGEAMAFRPVVLMADEIRREKDLNAKYGEQAKAWLEAAEKCFEKWNSYETWREIPTGGVWVVPDFGIDQATGKWTSGFNFRASTGFTNPDNKQNVIARWMLAMNDVTRNAVYRERAEKWFRVMKSRMKTQQDGKYFIWNYWEPAGRWDFGLLNGGAARHWIGVHPNGGYYELDVEGIVAGYEHGLVFTKDDIARLIATNRDFMWNQQMKGAKFQRIDGGEPDPRWKDTPGKLWTALVPHDAKLREIFLANFDPASWDGLWVTPCFLSQNK